MNKTIAWAIVDEKTNKILEWDWVFQDLLLIYPTKNKARKSLDKHLGLGAKIVKITININQLKK